MPWSTDQCHVSWRPAVGAPWHLSCRGALQTIYYCSPPPDLIHVVCGTLLLSSASFLPLCSLSFKAHSGYPQFLRDSLTFSFYLSILPASEMSVSAWCINILTMPSFCCTRWCEVHWRHWSMCVGPQHHLGWGHDWLIIVVVMTSFPDEDSRLLLKCWG